MMSFETLTLDLSDSIAQVVLNRPEKRNAMNAAFWTEMRQLFQLISKDPAVRVVVVSSTGPHFTAGLDLKSFAGIMAQASSGCEGRKREALRRLILEMQESFSVLERCPVPVLTAIQGGCIGGGVDMVSAADMRYCCADSYFVIKEIDIGMTADVGTLQRLPHLIPQGLVRELAYTGRKLTADEALQSGLVNKVYQNQEEMLAGVMEIAKTIASKSPLSIQGCKEMLNYSRDHSVEDSLNYVATWNAGMLLSNDLMEAMAAAQQKRDGDFDDVHPGFTLG
ncbi:MAG: crotonase/enoyl-CoA hydratase family protein [Planctomycetota bacterium]|nr:crotonase/enoyl-CoA hydratase family protein [Planctomycetota bacterium]